jgi:hypothetical protein
MERPMTADSLTNEQIDVYRKYRTAKKNLRKDREFTDWLKIMRGYDQARSEAMRCAGTNTPQGATYREEFAKIARREKLIDHGVDDNGRRWQFPTKEDRTYCIKVLENYDVPSYDPRRPSVKVWRAGLSPGQRSKLNHPKRVWSSYWTATEPRAEKDAKRVEREMKEPKASPQLEALADSEVREHDARRQIESLRQLLGLIRDAWTDLPDEIAAKIDAVLAE